MKNVAAESPLVEPAKSRRATPLPTVHLPAHVGAATLLSAGSMNTLLRVASDEGNSILKFYGELRCSVSPGLSAVKRAHAEHMALGFCRSNGLAAPLPIAQRGAVVVMSECGGSDLDSSPITVELVTRLLSWLHRLHSLPIPLGVAGGTVRDLHSLAAKEYMERYIAEHHEDADGRAVCQLLVDTPAPRARQQVTLHGDPTVRNWLIDDGTVHALDLEFVCQGDPIYDVGMLIGSLLNYGAFSCAIYSLCAEALRGSRCSLDGLPGALLCGLIIMAVSVPNDARRMRVFRRMHEAIEWARELEAEASRA